MKIRRVEIVLVTVVALMSWFFMFSFECYFGDEIDKRSHSQNKVPPFPDDRANNLFWFLQITDIHFSYVNNLSVSDTLQLFCHDVIQSVNPTLILVSGDLTHAKFPDERRSQQFASEWIAYRNVLQKCNLDQIPWLDIRGNHDAFNVPSFMDASNYFIEYSMSWKQHNSRSFCYSHQTSFGVYNFIGLDVCPDPGPRRPYNFFGVLHIEDLLSLKRFSRKKSNHTVWFTHYPSATIFTDHNLLRKLMGTSVAHVCGHLHTLGGLMPHMYGRHPSGHLELELADFKDSKRFRLMAFDHDLFSFVDATVGKWPLVLVTNPKNAKFLAPSREPTPRMLKSTHIRILVFSTANIESIQLKVDGHILATPAAIDGGPLYVSPWEPGSYCYGLHNVEVVVKDSIGRVTVYTHLFSLDDTPSPLDRLPQLLLLTDLHSLFRLAFIFIWLALLAILLLSWINQSERAYFYHFIQTKIVFYPYLLSFAYFGLGPWYYGELITGVYGFVCVHGIYLMGQFMPGSMTYLHGTIQVLLVHGPLLWSLNHVLSRNSKTCQRWTCNCVMLVCILVQVLWVITAYPYGYLAFIISPGGTWPLLLNVWVIYKALKNRKLLLN